VSYGLFNARSMFTLAGAVVAVVGGGFLCRFITLQALPLTSRDNVTMMSIMPEDAGAQPAMLTAITSGGIEFLNNEQSYLAYEMPVDYIMQGMIANTGTEHHLYKRHHTIGLIVDWVLHPFEHLRRSPSVQMARMHKVDPATARRHHCPLGINNPQMDCDNCEYRRVVFVEVDSPGSGLLSGKELFAFNTTRLPSGYVDISTKTGEIMNKKAVETKTAWSDVPTPAI